ncbi:MAG TPA: hypothetical protein DCY13_01570, partial [Verrucomicrobiales bacterium]|nr:hypothetical protein [Verrucomicrobiales bacterium]
AGTLGFAAEVVNIWNVRAFNRRSKAFEVEWIGRQGDGSLVSIGPFAIANPVPVPSDHPQFHPEPLPQHKSSGNLVVTLEGFVSGIPAGDREPSGKGDLLPKTTRLELAFNENQNPSTNYRLQRLIVSDATGNRWQPYFDHARPRSNERVDGGTAILPGALWPSEQAWKLEVEVLRHEYFAPEELWAPPPLPLDAGPRYLPLGHQFAAGSGSIQLANLVPPGLIASNQWQWTVRYWGNESNVFAVGVQFPEPMPNRRLLVVEATDDSGRAVPLVEHRGADHPQQALLFRPEPDATQLQLRLAVPELHRVEFLARPEFHPRK